MISRTFLNNMKAFGLENDICSEFLHKMSTIGELSEGEKDLGGWKQFPVLSKTFSLMGHYNLSLSVDAIMVSTNCPIIGERVTFNCVA